MSYTPKSPEARQIVRSGLPALSELLAKCQSEGRTLTWPQEVYPFLERLDASAHEADARDHWGAVEVKKCPHCLGNGMIVISAGDGEWPDDCEFCERTGYIPVSFEP